MDENTEGARGGLGMPVDPVRLAAAFRPRLRSMVYAAVLTGLVGAVAAKTVVPREFEAQSVVECDRCGGTEGGDRELLTLQDAVKLPANIERVRDELALETSVEKLGRRIDVSASSESRLVMIKARAETGAEAAQVANALVAAFLDERLALERKRLEGRVRELSTAVDEARRAVTEARSAYDDFRKEHRIANLSTEQQAAIEQAARLRAEADLARAAAQAEEARSLSLRKGTRDEPAVTVRDQTEVKPITRRLADARSELAALRGQYTDEDPRVQAKLAEVEALKERLGEGEDVALTGQTKIPNPILGIAQENLLRSTAEQKAAEKRQELYLRMEKAARDAASRLSALEGEASRLLSVLNIAERHLTMIELDLAIAEDAARTPATGLHQISPAPEPTFPAKSRRRLVALLAPVAGLVVAALVVLVRALRGGRVHTAIELAYWGRAPVIASSTWPRVHEARDDLTVDLAACLRGAEGRTLLLGTGHDEHALGSELAEALEAALDEGDASPPPASPRIDVRLADLSDPKVRREARQADRLIVLVSSGKHSALALRALMAGLDRARGVAFVLIDVPPTLATLCDRAGPPEPWPEPEASARPVPSLPPPPPPRRARGRRAGLGRGAGRRSTRHESPPST